MSESDMMGSTDAVTLPTTLQTHIFERCNLWWKGNGPHLLFVNLKAYEVIYHTSGDANLFEIC